MPRVIVALALAVAAVLVASPARAEPPHWELDSRLGYADSWTTAQSYLGVGSGLAAGATLRVPVHLEIAALYHSGSVVSAANESVFYWSRQWSVLGNAAVGYDIRVHGGCLVLRPQAVLGAVFASDTTRIGDATRRGLDVLATMGLGGAALVRFGDLHAGIDARALFVPARVAAPIGAVYGVFGVEL